MRKIRKSTPTPNRPAKRRTADALAILDRIKGGDPKLRRLIADATINVVAEMLYEADNEPA
ncbi:MAG TPA: hypothetical protein VNT79_07790 [Phycisphaerae bacterium]|nr:hypothetical protein [Phycisphaerae bacterium]